MLRSSSITTLAINHSPASYNSIDIWIGEAVYLGKGYGTQMMQLAIA
jgi:hypothetical protein